MAILQLSIGETTWQERRKLCLQKLAPWVEPHLQRLELGKEHAVYDFLFSYYSFRPSLLTRWSPGISYLLEGKAAAEFLRFGNYTLSEGKVSLSPAEFPKHRIKSARWALSLLEKISERPPQFGCSGMHEWAMEFKSLAKRYPSIPLRLEPTELEAFVSSQEIRCSHYDAFRFFTPPAKSLNALNPTKITQPDFEQPGCLHVNMDLYKWGYKFYPWIGSDLIADLFLLAAETRKIDMRASPYDLTQFGFEPIAIETASGRAEYQKLQCETAEKAMPLRSKLLEAYRAMIDWAS